MVLLVEISNSCVSGVATENICSFFIAVVQLNFQFCIIFTFHHSIEFDITFWDCMVKIFLKVIINTSLLPDDVLDDTLDDDIPDGEIDINDNNNDENYKYDSNENNGGNQLNDDNNDNDNNYDNDNDGQMIIIFQTMHFIEHLIYEKVEFLTFTHIYMHR